VDLDLRVALADEESLTLEPLGENGRRHHVAGPEICDAVETGTTVLSFRAGSPIARFQSPRR